ncbi:alginate O-acetyltransferase AlgX-related protein [Undibacterium squillarum]|uniref:Cell division protein FtsQ n=1 Tax=Undibacterium squillarum TaxID=1131567 RepID=A0ABQ2XZJ8_9BURK|nr:cell division protein FtsQ [Undibacterium squillarum]GGX44370.1 cell division protein FtsQ [Undibacterium squillarum]
MSESFQYRPEKAGVWKYLPALAFGLITVGGLIAGVRSLQQIPAEKWTEMADWRKVAQGESTRVLTSQLNEHFIFSKDFAATERAVSWNLARDTGAQVRPGCPGWFFLTEELTTFDGGPQNARARAWMVTEVARQLKQRGIPLVIAMVPDKARIEAAQTCGLHRPAAFAARYDLWMNEVRAAGITVLDLREPLQQVQGERYYRTDSHWNEAGASAVSAYIAQQLRQQQLITTDAAPMNAETVKSRQGERMGDLYKLSSLNDVPLWARPATEVTTLSDVAPVAVQSDDLFGDSGLPALSLIGTSFSLRGNFVPFLSRHVGAPVANLAKDGGAFDGAAQAFFHSKVFEQEPPKLIVWEIPERMLQRSFDAKERAWYQTLKQGKL